MKILLANKFYYRRGGDCVHTLNLEQLLKAHGHEVAVFAMDYPENLKTQWSKYFPSEVKFKLGTGMIAGRFFMMTVTMKMLLSLTVLYAASLYTELLLWAEKYQIYL